MKKKFFIKNKFYCGILIFSTNSSICFGGGDDNFETIIETEKLHNIAIVPKPSGEIPSIALGRTKSIPAWWVKETFFEKSVQRTVSSTSEDDLQS